MDMVTVVSPGLVILGVSLNPVFFVEQPIPGVTNQTYSTPPQTPTKTVSLAGGRFYPEDCDVYGA